MQADPSVLEHNKCVLVFSQGLENTIKKKNLTESVNTAYFLFCSDIVCFRLGKEENIIGDLMLASLHLNDSP